MSRVRVAAAALATMRAAAAQAAPAEACGLLLGEGDRIERAQPTANVAADPLGRFEIEPAALIAAHRAARAGGPALVGYFHSHPTWDPRPSAVDREHASCDGRVWAIVAAGAVTFWRDTAAGFAPVGVEVV